jgi:hypothetical protein
VKLNLKVGIFISDNTDLWLTDASYSGFGSTCKLYICSVYNSQFIEIVHISNKCYSNSSIFKPTICKWHTVKLKRKTQSPCLIKDYRNAELTRSLCVYVDGPRNNGHDGQNVMSSWVHHVNKMYAISKKSGIKWSTTQINFNVHIKITKHCDDKE